MTPKQIDNWFTYHAPTEETAPKYAAIREAETRVRNILFACIAHPKDIKACFDAINAACRNLAEVIDAQAPDCADKTAAIRCVRLARNAANEAIATIHGDVAIEEMISLCLQESLAEAMKARWQANSAIACDCR